MTLLVSLLALLPGASRAQSPRLSVGSSDVPPRLAARVAQAVARAWGTDTTGLVLSWGSGSLAQVDDSTAFRLLGHGEDGWFVVSVEPEGKPARAIRLRAGLWAVEGADVFPHIFQGAAQRVMHEALEKLVVDLTHELRKLAPLLRFGGIADAIEGFLGGRSVDGLFVRQPLPAGIRQHGLLGFRHLLVGLLPLFNELCKPVP